MLNQFGSSGMAVVKRYFQKASLHGCLRRAVQGRTRLFENTFSPQPFRKSLSLLLAINVFYLQSVFALIDPTRPANYASKQGGVLQTTLELTGIVISNDHKIAIINGQRVKVGDKILDKKVIKIEEDTVELLGTTGNSTILRIGGQSIKQEK